MFSNIEQDKSKLQNQIKVIETNKFFMGLTILPTLFFFFLPLSFV